MTSSAVAKDSRAKPLSGLDLRLDPWDSDYGTELPARKGIRS